MNDIEMKKEHSKEPVLLFALLCVTLMFSFSIKAKGKL